MPVTRIGVQAVTGSPGQIVDIDPARITATITNAGSVAVEYSTGGAWTSIAAGVSASVSCDTHDLRLRRGVSGAYPAPVDIDWTATSEGEATSLTEAQARAVQALVSAPGNPLTRLRAAMDAAYNLTLMASPPTVTQSAAGAASTLTGATNLPTSAILQWPATNGQVFQNPNFIDSAAENVAFSGSRCITSYFFATDATAFEVYYRPDSVNSDFRVWADGQLATAVIPGPAFDGSFYRQKIDFGGSRKLRQIEIEGLKAPPANIIIGGGDSYQVPTVPSCTAIFIGDSFTEGTGASRALLGYASIMAKLLGIRKALFSGLGGTGYSATNPAGGNNRKRLRNRFLTDITPFPADVVFWVNGVNDSGVTQAQLAADTNAAFDLGVQYYPNALHVVFPGFSPRSSLPVTTRDTIRDCAAGRANFYFIDTYAANEIYGTGRAGATTGVGNSDWIVDSGGTHPGDAGHEYLGRYRANAVRALLGL